ncbi:hypothetical protein ACS0TY_007733 [Phlomoides rotata]
MAEASKVRLVRCPKCENLLPELPDFSVYQCGGCGAVLEAKKKVILEDKLLETSDDVKGVGISEEDGIVKVSNKVDIDNADGIRDVGGERIQGLASNGSSTSPPINGEAPTESSDITRRGKERIRSVDSSDDEYRPYTQGLVRNRNQGRNRVLNVNGPEHVNFRDENVEGIRPPMDASKSRAGVKSNGSISGAPRSVSSQVKSDDFRSYNEGQSSYGMNSYYEQCERSRYRGHNLEGIDRIEQLENGRAELLRKLEELKNQITQSPKEKIVMDQRMASLTSPDPYGRHHAPYAQEGLINPQGANRQPLPPDDILPPYFSHPSGYVPYSDRYGSRLPDSYSQRGYQHDHLPYPNAYKPEIVRRHPHQPQSQYMQQPFHEHFPGYYGDVNHDHFMLHRHENFFHQPACSCVHCYDKNWHMPPRVEPPGLHNRRPQNEPSNPTFHQHLNPVLHNRQSLTLNSGELDSENDGFNYHRPRKMIVAHRSGRVSYPIGGGAPFITCSNCFQLLKLPRRHMSIEKDQQKLKCGACSSIILFEIKNRGAVASASTDVDQLPTEIDEVSGVMVDDNVRYWNDDFDHKLFPTDEKSNSGMPEKQLEPLSSTSSFSEDEQSLENISSRKHDSPPSEFPLEEDNSVPGQSPENMVVTRFDKWNKSKRPDLEKVSLERMTSKQNSGRDATETDVSLNAFSNSNISQDSVEISRDNHQKVNKGGDSFFAGLIKKSFRDFKRSNHSVEGGGSQVFVNGYLIPDRVVKKAEKLAGPIQPGEYWYDKRAGFWGVMGHSCLGIIMPNIEEFNYPMPKNCAAGNTGVFVNDRELHEKDFDLLVSRGLPITRNRSYLIEISGKVVDEQTGEELDGLGKLAPTIERAKHGFGMKVPRFISQSKS